MKSLISISVVCVFLLTSCFTPAPVIRLLPKTVGKKDYWNMGTQFVCDENNKISYECSFKKMEIDKVIYNVKITNNSDVDVLVIPEKFWQNVFKDDTLKISTDYADNPEIVLLNNELESSKAKAAAKNAMVVGVVSTVATIGAVSAVAASDQDENSKAVKSEIISDANAIVLNSAIAANESANNTIAENYNQHYLLSEAYLRKTTLPPGYYIDGEVRFPYNKDARWYCIQLEVDKSNVEFYFRQVLFYPAEYNTTR